MDTEGDLGVHEWSERNGSSRGRKENERVHLVLGMSFGRVGRMGSASFAGPGLAGRVRLNRD